MDRVGWEGVPEQRGWGTGGGADLTAETSRSRGPERPLHPALPCPTLMSGRVAQAGGGAGDPAVRDRRCPRREGGPRQPLQVMDLTPPPLCKPQAEPQALHLDKTQLSVGGGAREIF